MKPVTVSSALDAIALCRENYRTLTAEEEHGVREYISHGTFLTQDIEEFCDILATRALSLSEDGEFDSSLRLYRILVDLSGYPTHPQEIAELGDFCTTIGVALALDARHAGADSAALAALDEISRGNALLKRGEDDEPDVEH